MVTFEEARQIAVDTRPAGTVTARSYGYEDDDNWLIILDGDHTIGAAAPLVNKTTGEVGGLYFPANADKFFTMRRYEGDQ